MEGTDDEHAVSNRSNLTALKVAISNPVMPPYPDLAMCKTCLQKRRPKSSGVMDTHLQTQIVRVIF
jgi:hypothetical protein